MHGGEKQFFLFFFSIRVFLCALCVLCGSIRFSWNACAEELHHKCERLTPRLLLWLGRGNLCISLDPDPPATADDIQPRRAVGTL